jgi:hypothetical protein
MLNCNACGYQHTTSLDMNTTNTMKILQFSVISIDTTLTMFGLFECFFNFYFPLILFFLQFSFWIFNITVNSSIDIWEFSKGWSWVHLPCKVPWSS